MKKKKKEIERKKEEGKWNIMYEPISNENEEKQDEFQV